MDRGDRVKFKSGSKARHNWLVGDEMAGTIIARYRIPRRPGPERLDVRFGGGIVVWGERASEFEQAKFDTLQ
ncbi:MAG: hypothetical protein RL735_688 [Pseudomonadota bacterium]|jgi:hypothetical protein